MTDDPSERAPEAIGPAAFRSGFVTVVGRPNVGKSTLVNRLVGQKVSIVSDRPQTTRTQVRGVRTTATSQLVFLDTPGIHRPRTMLGERTNDRALATLDQVDVVCLVLDASVPIGRGDRFVAALVREAHTPAIVVVNKIDAASKPAIAAHLAAAASELEGAAAFVPLSARSGDGVDLLAGELEARMPEGPHYYPDGVVSDQPESVLAAEILREKLLALTRDELPHSIAVTAEEMEERQTAKGPLLAFRLVVRVERDSQRGIVIGRGGTLLRQAGTEARLELEALLGVRVHLDTHVRVDRDWQRRAGSLDRLGL